MPDLRTENEKKKDARNAAICNEYVGLRKETNYSKHRIHVYLADKFGMSYPGVASIVKAAGINF